MTHLSSNEIDQILGWLQEHYPYELIKKLEVLKEEARRREFEELTELKNTASDIMPIVMDWVICKECWRAHLASCPCLPTELARDSFTMPCYWFNGFPYLFHECLRNPETLPRVETEILKRNTFINASE